MLAILMLENPELERKLIVSTSGFGVASSHAEGEAVVAELGLIIWLQVYWPKREHLMSQTPQILRGVIKLRRQMGVQQRRKRKLV